jgi:trans-2,3-dihydro-3-hydroxyanthranilate isomerase
MNARYRTVDVFTDRAFAGNPLAVVLDAADLSTSRMQAIAAEFNYAETTFVLPPADPAHTARVRIFTPRQEIPFAGHPNVGTAFVLATQNPQLAVKGNLVFEEDAGLVPVVLLSEAGAVVGAELTAPEPLGRLATVPRKDVADCLHLQVEDVLSAKPQVISVGLPFLVAELASRDALRRAKPDLAAHERVLPLDGADAIYVYTRDVGSGDVPCDLMSRMFAPLDGIPEDPATGSATAAVAALLAETVAETAAAAGQSGGDGDRRLRVLQGVDLGRPSLLFTRVSQAGGRVTSVHVGGRCVHVMAGTIQC